MLREVWGLIVPAEPFLLTVPEAAQLLRIGRNRCYELVNSGSLPAIKIGRTVRIPRQQLMAWIEAQSVNGHGLTPVIDSTPQRQQH